jgi:hypothetical protein
MVLTHICTGQPNSNQLQQWAAPRRCGVGGDDGFLSSRAVRVEVRLLGRFEIVVDGRRFDADEPQPS